MRFKDKVFPSNVGGYPGPKGISIGMTTPPSGKLDRDMADELRLRISDDLPMRRRVPERTVAGGPVWQRPKVVEATLNGVSLPLSVRDASWKDPQISPRATRSGGSDKDPTNASATGFCRGPARAGKARTRAAPVARPNESGGSRRGGTACSMPNHVDRGGGSEQA